MPATPLPGAPIRSPHLTRAVLLLAAGLSLVAVAAEPSFIVEASPAIVRLGTDREAALTVTTPPEVARLQLSASIGRVEGLERVAPGKWRARYLPPEPTYPQVAVISAIAEREGALAFGWTRVPLWGQGDAMVRARPRARISVRIGDQEFGPVIASGKGVALVPVVVPPGTEYGYHGTKPIDLGLPKVPHVHLALVGDTVRADRPSVLSVVAFAVTAEGGPDPGAQVRFGAAHGQISAPVRLGPGAWVASWTVPAGTPGPVGLSAWLANEPTLRASATARRVPGPPATLAFSSRPAPWIAGSGPLRLELSVRDAAGNPTSGDFVAATSLGTVTGVAPSAPGKLAVSVAVPDRLPARSLSLELRDRQGGAPHRFEVALAAGAPAELAIELADERVIADHRSVTAIVARVLDAFGNPVDELVPSAEVDLGELLPSDSAGPGALRVQYRPPLLAQRAEATVRIAADGLTARRMISLVPPAKWLQGAASVGVVSNARDLTAPTAALELLANGALFGQRLGAGIELGGFRFGPPESIASGPFAGGSLSGQHQYLTLQGAVRWYLPLAPHTALAFGAHAGAARVDSRLAVLDQPAIRESTYVPSGGVSVGLVHALGPGQAFAELRGAIFGDPGLRNLTGALPSARLALGYRFDLL